MSAAKHSPIKLKTNRTNLVLIEMLTLEDDKAYFDLQNVNREYWREFDNTIDETVEAVTKRRLRVSNGRYGIWFEGKLIGMVGYSNKANEQEAEVGILLSRDAAGKGFATEAVKTLTAHIKPRFRRVFAEIERSNAASIRLFIRSGYKQKDGVVEREWGKAVVFEAQNTPISS